MSRRKREREAPEVGAMARRVVRALVRRADEGDTEALEQLLALEGHVRQAITDAGGGLHRFGYTYGELAQVAGTSRQAARERFGRAAFDRRHELADTPSAPAIPDTTDTTEHDARMGLAR